tara:strand:- start:39 stop:353 length:315 start_codon:yes stop_codon:yes gene_type:complete
MNAITIDVQSTYPECPCCTRTTLQSELTFPVSKLFVCLDCGAIYGDCFRHVAESLIRLDEWEVDKTDQLEQRYFDFTFFDQDAKITGRSHGWFNHFTRRITQTG